MKISILKESLSIGGTERSAANISLALSKKHEVATVLYNGEDMAYTYGGELYDMKLPPKSSKLDKVINNFRRAAKYKKHIKEFKPDVVFQFLSLISPVGFMKLNNCVKVVSARDFSSLSQNCGRYKKRLDTADAMICNSNYLRDFFTSEYPEDKEKVFAVSNIIDVDFIKKQWAEEADGDFLEFRKKHGKLIVAVGRFCKEKAFEHLLAAFAKVREKMPDAGLVLVGDGEFKERYLQAIDEYKLKNGVFFTGYQKNPYKYMSKCDLFVLSSQSEGFPNVLAEAMALSLPVVSVNCLTGPAEILMKDYDYTAVKDGFAECDYGILTPHYDAHGVDFAVDELSKAILHVLADEELMKKYSGLSAQRAAEYSADSAVEKLERIFETLVARRG